MEASLVLHLLRRFGEAGVPVWIGGGWGIDALVGRQTRPHADLDLIHDQTREPAALAVLTEEGFAETLDLRPVRFVLDGPAELDMHPVRFAEDGSAVQSADNNGATFTYPADCFVTGRIEGVEVPCLSVGRQLLFHQGYEPRERDLHDMAQLRAEFGVTTAF
ncbi:nucleotidyltransferase domain-containing protein [Amycolatopsis sp. YIM 10]|uniref:nucleotidyltransferase domain-containing protein n=1 Tax=Amycolatopsis sp. YIM 10 TaxID=2653857 RepID=UPI00129008C0|nr:amino acid transporter [Amycolatopsis sp. YIM 10]QFU89014.1 Lincosamide resistance protein [Amycolatopsis sp. YIM 10]